MNEYIVLIILGIVVFSIIWYDAYVYSSLVNQRLDLLERKYKNDNSDDK